MKEHEHLEHLITASFYVHGIPISTTWKLDLASQCPLQCKPYHVTATWHPRPSTASTGSSLYQTPWKTQAQTIPLSRELAQALASAALQQRHRRKAARNASIEGSPTMLGTDGILDRAEMYMTGY